MPGMIKYFKKKKTAKILPDNNWMVKLECDSAIGAYNSVTGTVIVPSSKIESVGPNGESAVYLDAQYSITDPVFSGIGTGDFFVSMDMMLKTVGTDYQYILGGPESGMRVRIRFGNTGFANRLMILVGSSDTNDTNLSPRVTITTTPYTKTQFLNTWHNVAFIRKNSQISMWVDNTQCYVATSFDTGIGWTAPNTQNVSAVSGLILGCSPSTSRGLKGWLRNFQIGKEHPTIIV